MDSTSIPSIPSRRTMPISLPAIPVLLVLAAGLLVNFFSRDGHDFQRVIEIAALLLGAAVVLLGHRPALAGLPARDAIPVCLFLLLGCVSAALSFAPRFAFYEVASFFLLWMIAMQAAREIARRGAQGFMWTLHGVGAICALYSVKFIVAYLGSFALGTHLDMADFAPGFSNIRFFNHAQTAMLPLLVLLCGLTPKRQGIRFVWFATTILWWVALIVTAGRGTMLGIAAGCALVAAVRRRAALPYLKTVVSTAALGILAYFVFLVLVPQLAGSVPFSAFSHAAERTIADPASGRLILWRRAAGLIAQHPWFGVGPMHFAHRAGDLQIGAHPHDWILQIASEWGLPAFLCLCIAIARGARTLLAAGARIDAHDVPNLSIHTALLATGAAILVDGMVSGVLVMPQSQLAISLYLACAAGWFATVVPASPAPQRTPLIRMGALAVIAIAATAIVAGTWPELPARLHDAPLSAAQQARNAGTLWPRLWQAGYF